MSTASSNPVDGFLSAVTAATIETCDVWSDDVVLDATVPGWRYRREGPAAIRDVYADWFADPGAFEELRRIPFPSGEVVEYLLTWIEDGVPHAARHMHVLDVRDGRIVRDSVVCGGRWPAGLLAEMEAAQRQADAHAHARA